MLRHLFIFLFLLCSTRMYAQWKSHFTTDDGLPSDKAYMTMIDAHGFLWCATDQGIAMYNGKEFTKFTVKEGLPINDIWVLMPTADGKVWYFGKSPELGYIEKGKIKKFKSSGGQVMNPINYFIEDNNIGFYYGMQGYVLENNEWKLYTFGQRQREYYKQFTGKAIVSANAYYDVGFVYTGEEFLYLNNNLDTLSRLYVHKKITKPNPVKALFHKKDWFLLATTDNLLLYDFKKKKVTVIGWGAAVYKSALDPLNLLLEDGKPIIVCKTGQYYIKDSVLVPNVLYETEIDNQGVVNYNTDMLGNIWVNTQNDGVYRITISDHVKTLFEGKVVKSLVRWRNKIYAGVQETGLYRINDDFSTDNVLDHRMYWYDLKNYQDKYMEILTSHGYFLYNGERFDSIMMTIGEKRYMLGAKASIHLNDTLLVATSGNITSINFNTLITLKNIGLYAIYAIEKYAGNVFMGGNAGLRIYRDGQIFTPGLLQDVAIKCFKVWNNLLMVGTDGKGIYITDGKTLYKPDYFKDLIINNFFVDETNHLWIGSNLGVHSVYYDTVTHQISKSSILKSQGLIDNNVNDILMVNDSLYCATNEGLCIVDIRRVNYTSRPEIIIKELNLNDSLYDPENSPVHITNRGNNLLTIVFDIGFLSEHEQLRLYYKVDPINKEWIEFNSNELNFNGLEVGTYKIQIRAEGFNNSDETELVVVIRPRWFEQTYVRIIGIFLLLVLLSLVVFIIIRTVNRNLRNKYLLKKRLVDIEQDALRSKLNPHFIFNTLNSIQYYITHNDIDSSEKYLLLFSNHIRDIFESSHSPSLPLEKEIRLLKDYLDIEMMRFEEKVSYEIDVDQRLDIFSVFIPTMILQPFIENALKHGLLLKKTKGKVSVHFEYINDKSYRVAIIDNGKGIRPAEYLRRSSTSLIEKRIELLNQSGEWHIVKEVKNIHPDQEEKGTIIHLLIEYKNIL